GGLPASLRIRGVPADPGRSDAHAVSRRPHQAVLHLPQPRLPAVATGSAQAAGPGVASVRLVLSSEPPRPQGTAGMGSVSPLGASWAVRQARGWRFFMSFLDAAAQSRTFTRARADLIDGFRRRELWLHLGWQDIKQRYRRSVLGPFWITIATGTTAVAMGGL